jgi:hypothetical protein
LHAARHRREIGSPGGRPKQKQQHARNAFFLNNILTENAKTTNYKCSNDIENVELAYGNVEMLKIKF